MAESLASIGSTMMSGQLMAWPKNKNLWPVLKDLEHLRVLEEPRSYWTLFEIRVSDISVFDSTIEATDIGGDDVTRHILVCESGNHLLMLGSHSKIVSQFLSSLELSFFWAEPSILIQELVTYLSHPRHEVYAITKLYARVDVDGRDFNTISAFGYDLAGSDFFKEGVQPSITPYRVELRDRISDESLLSVSSNGEVSCYCAGVHSLKNIERTLKFLSSSRLDKSSDTAFLSWPSGMPEFFGPVLMRVRFVRTCTAVTEAVA